MGNYAHAPILVAFCDNGPEKPCIHTHHFFPGHAHEIKRLIFTPTNELDSEFPKPTTNFQ